MAKKDEKTAGTSTMDKKDTERVDPNGDGVETSGGAELAGLYRNSTTRDATPAVES